MSKYEAARMADFHMCPAHGGGPINKPAHAKGMVLIGGLPAARTQDTALCPGVADMIMKGSPSVFIGGMAAARKGDATIHGGVVMTGFARVLIGGTNAPTTDAEALEQAMNIIRTSEFAKTAEGKKVLAKLEELHKDGRIHYDKQADDTAGAFVDQNIGVNRKYNRDPNRTASTLVHEGTHGNEQDRLGDHKNTIDEEMHTRNNQLDLYEEQRKDGFTNSDLEKQRTARQNGTLRDTVRKRYPTKSEH